MSYFRRFFEYLALRLEHILSPLIYRLGKIFAPQGVSRKTFEQIYRRPDPWRYATSAYELAKQDRALDVARRDGRTEYERVLEIGCAEGVFTEKLAERDIGRQIVGVDISSTAIARARDRCARFERVRFHCANILDELPDGQFDLIFILEVLYYLGRDLRTFCTRIAPHLKDGYRLILMHPVHIGPPMHRSVQELLGLRVVSEHLEKDSPRPYLITVLEKPTSLSG